MASSLAVSLNGAATNTSVPTRPRVETSFSFSRESRLSTSSTASRRAAEIGGASVKMPLPRAVSVRDSAASCSGACNAGQARSIASLPKLQNSVCISSAISPSRISRGEAAAVRCSATEKRPESREKSPRGFRSYTPPDDFSRGSSNGSLPGIDDEEELPMLREYTRRKEPPAARGEEESGDWEYRRGSSPSTSSNLSGLTQGVNKYVLGGLFVLGMGAGIAVDTVLNVEPNNIASREVIDRQTPNPDVCIANGMSAMVLDQRLFITFNPFNVYVSQAEVKPGCVLRQSNWRVLESRGLVNSEEVRDCKRNFNTFGFVGDLRQAPEINCVYHSEAAENQFLKDPSKAALGDGFQPKDFTPE